MKRIGLVLIAASLAAAGCTGGIFNLHLDPGISSAPVVNSSLMPWGPPPAVTANQINDANAHAMAQALAEEMDFDQQWGGTPPNR